MFKLSNRSKERLNGVDERILEIIDLALSLSKIDFGMPEFAGLRTTEQQNKLFKNGLSKCDGYIKKSYHQSGKAFDIYAYVDGGASWDRNYLTHIAAAILQAASMLEYKLEWGGLFDSFTDMPHFQLID